MPRKISTGRVGRPVLGDIFTEDNAFKSVVTNANIAFSPDGTGIVESDSDIQLNATNGIRFADSDSSNYVLIKSPDTVASNVTLTLPANDGDANQVLTTNGSGVLSWASSTISIEAENASGSPYYPLISSSTSGNISTAQVGSNGLTFVPLTGTLTATIISTGNVDINGGAIDGVTLGTNSAVTSAVITTADINGGSIDGTTIGGTAPETGTFTTLNVTTANLGSSVDINGGNIDGTTIGASSAANGTFADLTATNITETSSIIYKENVSPIMNALESIVKLQGVTYDRKDNSRKNEAGLIAEDVAKVIPNVVAYKKGTPDGINYTKLTAYLIEAVKTLEAEISMLKGK